MKRLFGLLMLAAMAAPASAQIAVDGTRDGAYGGPALVLIGTDGVTPSTAVQTVQTQFGDNQSEMNAGYASISGGRLYLMLTGNIQDTFNKLEIFIDSKVGGQAVFDSSGNDDSNRMDGLVFDAGFTADYHLIARRGNFGGPRFDFDFADLAAQSASGYFDIFTSGDNFGSGSTGTGVNALPIDVAYDGSNSAGVTGGTGPADQTAAAAVTTGLELSIALSDLGYIGGPLHVMVGQNGDGHHFWSNQFLGGLPINLGNDNTPPLDPGTSNLGGDGAGNFTGEGAVNMNDYLGNQFFTVVAIPEPASVALAGLGLLGVLLAVRRK